MQVVVIEVTGGKTDNYIQSSFMSPPNWFGVRFGAAGSLQTNEQIICPVGNRVYGCVRLSVRSGKIHWNGHFAHSVHTAVHRINTVVSKAIKFSSINTVADLIGRETQKSFYTESGTINTAMHVGLLNILLHPRECSGIYFTGILANQIHLSYTHIFCNVKQNKVRLSD